MSGVWARHTVFANGGKKEQRAREQVATLGLPPEHEPVLGFD